MPYPHPSQPPGRSHVLPSSQYGDGGMVNQNQRKMYSRHHFLGGGGGGKWKIYEKPPQN